ncbi:putative quinol monooxygenase [Nocardia brasiliensis]|uniref:putative quinol monooxygenase n=1 Tax=Nocardia brasiliensis TaxID=37326 RepID=UPI00366C386B
MLIIAGHVEVDPAHRDAYVAAFRDLVNRARRAPGCLDVAITADPLDPARVYNFERWDSRENLEAWRSVANAPDPGIPIKTDHVLEYTVTNARPPFG